MTVVAETDNLMRKVIKTPVRLSNNFYHAWTSRLELFIHPRPCMSVKREGLIDNSDIWNQDFCVYDIIEAKSKSGMVIKMQNKLHDRLFSGLMRQFSKDDTKDARAR